MENWFSKPMPEEVDKDLILERDSNGEFHDWKFEPFTMQENGYEGVIDKLKTFLATDYEKKSDEDKEKMVNEVLAIYREVDIFPIQYYSEMGVINEIMKCVEYKAKFDGNVVSCGAGIGTTLCNYLFPNIFDTPSKHDLDKKGAETLYAKFHNDEYLKRAIKFCFSYKDGCPVPTNVMGGLRLVGSAPTNFRPMNAKAIYERFAPEGGVIYDFCCVDDETEFFNGKEWKSISDYQDGEKVLQYNEDGSAELVIPEDYINYESDDDFYEYNDGRLNSCLTGNHDIAYRDIFSVTGELTKEVFKIKQKDIVGKNFKGAIPTTFLFGGNRTLGKGKATAFAFLRKYCSTVDSMDINCRLSSERLTLFTKSMDNAGLTYVIGSFSDRNWNVHVKKFNYNGILKESEGKLYFGNGIYGLSIKDKEDIIDVLDLSRFLKEGESEGNESESVKKISTNNLEELDIVQFLYTSCGRRVLIVENSKNYLKYSIEVRKDLGRSGNMESYQKYSSEKHPYNIVKKKKKFCFVVSSHLLVLRRGKKIFITGNCGFGGRLLGCLSSKKNFKYVGTDPCTETMKNLMRLGEYIETATDRENVYELHCCGSEEFHGPENSVDFAFSSPPYFDLEVYSQEETQCFNKYPVLEDWLEGYVRGTIKNIRHMLKPSRCYAVNIADFKVGGGSECAYVDEWIRISTEEGMPLYDTVYLGVTARAGSKQQASGELKKENILIFKNQK